MSSSAAPNPFRMPSDTEIFQQRDLERSRRKEQKAELARLPIWLKSNTGRLANRKAELLGEMGEDGHEDDPQEKKPKQTETLPMIAKASTVRSIL